MRDHLHRDLHDMLPRTPLLRGLQQPSQAAASLNSTSASQPFEGSNATDTTNEHNHGTSGNHHHQIDQSNFIILLSFMLFLLLIVWLKHRLFRQPLEERHASPGQVHPVAVNEGSVVHLTGHQRRAILEEIFSETSKPVTESEVKKKPKRKRERSFLGFPISVPMFHIHTVATDTSADSNPSAHPTVKDCGGGADSMDAANDLEGNFTSRAGDLDEERQDLDVVEQGGVVTSNDTERINKHPQVDNHPTAPSSQSLEGDGTHAPTLSTEQENIPLHSMFPRSTSGQAAVSNQDDNATLLDPASAIDPLINSHAESECGVEDNKQLDLPTENKAEKEAKDKQDDIADHTSSDDDKDSAPSSSSSSSSTEKDEAILSQMLPGVRCARRDSCTSEYTHHDDGDDDDEDSTGENVCSICLGEYKAGELMVGSKYCSHMFHKDCLLEWLQNHNDCPICRVGMVTESEMSKAATTLVGKTRMYRAVATLHAAAAHVRRPHTSHSHHHAHHHHHHRRLTHVHPPAPTNRRSSPLDGTVRRAVQR